jgi:hypothetical protein
VQREAENNLQYEIVIRTDSNCVPKLAGMEVEVKQDNCRKKSKGDISVPANTIYRQNLRKFSERAPHDNRNDKLR